MPTYTFTDAEAPQFVVLEPGAYHFNIIKTEDAISAKGNQMLVIHCREAESGAIIKERLVFAATAAWKIDQCLKACGIFPPVGTQVNVDDDLLLGRTFEAQVVNEPGLNDETKLYNKIANFIPREKPAAKPEPKPAVQW